jgi:hypothetical protein
MRVSRSNYFVLLMALLALLLNGSFASAKNVDYSREVAPILSDRCYACHGPDEAKRKAGLRLDRKENAFAALKSGDHAIVPGDIGKSALTHRIESTDPDEQMPPPDSGKSLSKSEIETLKRWIAEGAEWKKHWSYIAPERPALPIVKDTDWPKNEVDYFVLDKLERSGLKPSPEANKESLIRRVSLDVTGLPPSIDEVDAFLADKSPAAYEKVVDRLLDTQAYGERMTVNWLDLARYADTSGYHFDSPRFMWLWRDWVINAFNQNMPFDEFTIEQLAGDMLPNATVQQRVASGFNRNLMTNDEGGADPDEYLNKYIVDRVSTLGVVWLGTTLGCAECHDHKFDPISTKEFYQLYAFFHNVPEKGLDGTRTENPLPRMSVPSPEQAVRLVELEQALNGAQSTLAARESELPKAQAAWEKELLAKGTPNLPSKNLEGYFAMQDSADYTDASSTRHPAKSNGAWIDGILGRGASLNGKDQFIDAGDLGSKSIERTNSFSYGAWIYPLENAGTVISRMRDDAKNRGIDLLLNDGSIEVHMVNEWPEKALKIRSKHKIQVSKWQHLFVTYDGSGKGKGVTLYVNGQVEPVDILNDSLSGSIATDSPLVIGKRSASFFFHGTIDEVRFFSRALDSAEVQALTMETLWPAVALAPERRSAVESQLLNSFFRQTYAGDYKNAKSDLAKLQAEKADLLKQIPNTMVMQEMEKPRDTFIMVRGNFQQKGEQVYPDVPKVWPALPKDQPANRLTLAKWLVSKENPLTSRVTVNRYWAMFFGTGLVKSVNDFGSQGEWPSHPELLEWLACQFRDGGGSLRARPWDIKALVKLIVTSSTYRQSSVVTPGLLEQDRYNRLLTRGPRLRLDAEFIRDNALEIAGLLNHKIGGESVRPYQPDGLWDVTDSKYVQSHGADLYRRGMYVYWKRAVHYPSFATFDAPNREVCTAQRPVTSTPLQSFVLMNDPVSVEAARGFATCIIQQGGKSAEERIVYAFRRALARRPMPAELATLRRTLERMQQTYSQDESSARELIAVGESKPPKEIPAPELAAYTCIANVILNLNETITR